MTSFCIPTWLYGRDQKEAAEEEPQIISPWQSHFGEARLHLVSLKDKKANKHWKADRILCPNSVHNTTSKAHALELINTHSSQQAPIQVSPFSHHGHTANHAFVQLQRDTRPENQDPYAFVLTVVHQNKVFYLGTQGLSTEASSVHVWLWKVQEEEEIKAPRAPGERQQDLVVITDQSDKYLFQALPQPNNHKLTVEFSSHISKNLHDAVFFVSPLHGFEHSFVSSK